jgi:hypothetical protein
VSSHIPSQAAGGDRDHAAHPRVGAQTAEWPVYELRYVRREAQAEAQLEYEAWGQLPGRDGYAVYRAAQDRADAAQVQLAALVRHGQTDR